MKKEEIDKLYIEHLKGDQNATWAILKHFDNKIAFLLRKYSNFIKYSLDDEEDFIQNCHLALLNALKTYDPSRGELEPYLLLKLNKVLDMTTEPQFNVSLDEVIDDNGTTISDILPYKKNDFDNFEKGETLKQMYSVLNEQEYQVIELYFFKELTECEIAAMLGCTHQYVSQIKNRALKKMKNFLK